MGTRERRVREREARRREIVDAARALFWAKGFTATTMPEIAEAAELAPGTLYLYFPSKDALYIELLLECYEDLIAQLRKAGTRGSSPRKQAEALVDAFFSFARKSPQCFDIIFFVLQRDVGGPRQTRLDSDQLTRLEACEAACKEAAAAVLHRAAPGQSDDDLRLTVEAVWSMLAGVVFFWRRDRGKTFDAVAGEARRVIVQALFG